MSYISEKNSQVTIWSVVLFGIICRIIYSRSYADELDPESKRLPIKIMFTQIRFVNQWMLFWSLLTGQVVWAYLRYSMNATYAQKFNQKVVYKWTLSFLLFSIFLLLWVSLVQLRKIPKNPRKHRTNPRKLRTNLWKLRTNFWKLRTDL